MFARLLSLFALLFAFAGPALAEQKIGTVDFQRALDNVAEGAAAKKRLEGMFSEKKAALATMEQQLKTMDAELLKQAAVLSDAAKQQKAQEFYKLQMQYQQSASVAEGEMQQAYMGAMETLIEKMKKLTQTIAAEKGYTLVVEVNEGGVVYYSPTIDMTQELITRYNAANPSSKPATPTTPPKK